MIIGKIINDQEAAIELEVVSRDQLEKFEIIIDTGFSGELTLPGSLIDRLRLPRVGDLPIILGDGYEVSVEMYLAVVLWHGEKRIVQVLRTDDGKPLIGMSLLHGNRLILDVITDGEVTIEPLS
ncbi:clan AA aspartic protease [Candidatus Poribacteria bacterium]|nr:clan AA aspartic protease [Candidatus Poribacteria bacterium]